MSRTQCQVFLYVSKAIGYQLCEVYAKTYPKFDTVSFDLENEVQGHSKNNFQIDNL